MCVDSLLLKFNSDEKQLTRIFISVFASKVPPIGLVVVMVVLSDSFRGM